ncbi:MAG: PIN domain-containing protein [bacterium]
MSDKYFIDTNIFIYTFDKEERIKQKKAKEIIGDALSSSKGIISVQVIQEFLNIATKKFKVPLTLQSSKKYLTKVLNPLCEVYPDIIMFELGLDIQATTNYSFYDSMIIAAAKKGGCVNLYSEDMQDSHEVRGLIIINPFK